MACAANIAHQHAPDIRPPAIGIHITLLTPSCHVHTTQSQDHNCHIQPIPAAACAPELRAVGVSAQHTDLLPPGTPPHPAPHQTPAPCTTPQHRSAAPAPPEHPQTHSAASWSSLAPLWHTRTPSRCRRHRCHHPYYRSCCCPTYCTARRPYCLQRRLAPSWGCLPCCLSARQAAWPR